MSRVGVFLDRDGTLSAVGGYCHPDEFSLLPYAGRAIHRLNQHGLPVIIVTNQTGIAHGKFSVTELHASFTKMLKALDKENAHVTAIYYCASKSLAFHKPSPGMLLAAAKHFHLSIHDCYMVGDTGYSDIRAAKNAGCQSILVKTGWGAASLTEYRAEWADIEPDQVVATVLDAAELICSQQGPPSTNKLLPTEIVAF